MDKKESQEKIKKLWSNLSDGKKVKWIRRAVQEEHDLLKDIPDNYKGILTKSEKELKDRYDGKPERPPKYLMCVYSSGYSLFSKIKLRELKNVPSKEKMSEISRQWRNLSDTDREEFNRQAVKANQTYKESYNNYLLNLNEDEKNRAAAAAEADSKAAQQPPPPPPQKKKVQHSPEEEAGLASYQAEMLTGLYESRPDISQEDALKLLAQQYHSLPRHIKGYGGAVSVLMLESAAKASASMLGTASNYRQSQTFTKVCLDHGAMINESCTPIPHSMRSDVDLHAASPVAQNKQGRVQDLASKQLSILQCNINGLCSTATKIKLEEIMEIAEKQKIQIIALQETKLNEKYNLKYKNYNILRKDRNKEGGGLAFLIKNLYYEDIAINIPNTSDLEAQGIKVYLNQNKTINIFNMYHPPNNKLIDDGTMAQFLTDNTIIVGDLNAKHQLWGCSTPNPRGKILSNLFDDNAFMCLNDGNPTHHSYSYNTAQALDISFSSPDIFHKCKWQILKSIGSDHLPILIEISTKTKTSSIKEKFWNFKKANWNLYQQNTNEDFRKAPTRIKDLEQNWISFKNTIIKAAKVSIPRGNIKKWIPNYTHQAKDIQTLITKRNELQKKCTQNQTNCRTELNIVNAKIKRLYVNMKREKWKQTCENLNPRNPNTKLWHLAKQIDRAQPQTENTNMIKNTDGTPATNDKNAANLLGNSYQISSKIKFEIKDKKVEKKARKIIHDCKNVTSTHNIFHEKINMKELDYALENTDLNKTPGPDGIHGQMISNLGKNGKEKLLDIFNNSWKTGKLPQDWKTATIIPIKKLDKSADDPKNYRPISLTSICCKLMEKIILRRLTYHLDTRNLLPKEQYGFRKGHGTIDQLLYFTQKTYPGIWISNLWYSI
ncbi:hypothetical protein LAZ67_12000736 [Cordylochernes scorpioides]|uniref:HMG box domain-containing protein n=1 Tax=Cordylochernes scorpioides TaxID=51811 RepID=A0ABY6L395_9ARAC|nr:hypothetical protein LAZ67_12000736 [Cordylochernes scorpioides]